MKKNILLHCVMLGLCLWLIIACFLLCSLLSSKKFETRDIANYGTYTGNYDNKTPTDFITSFFPEQIEPFFENAKYVYRAKKFDTYAYEVFLEFEINDEALFQEYVVSVTSDTEKAAFLYDDSYVEYNFSDELILGNYHPADKIGPDRYSIEYAEIGKILINDNKNRIIYIALGVYDGGGVDTAYLKEFFSYFNIDPAEYEMRLQKTGDTEDRGRFA